MNIIEKVKKAAIKSLDHNIAYRNIIDDFLYEIDRHYTHTFWTERTLNEIKEYITSFTGRKNKQDVILDFLQHVKMYYLAQCSDVDDSDLKAFVRSSYKLMQTSNFFTEDIKKMFVGEEELEDDVNVYIYVLKLVSKEIRNEIEKLQK